MLHFSSKGFCQKKQFEQKEEAQCVEKLHYSRFLLRLFALSEVISGFTRDFTYWIDLKRN